MKKALKTVLDKNKEGRGWRLDFTLWEKGTFYHKTYVRIIEFKVKKDEVKEVINRAFEILKRVVKRLKKRKLGSVRLWPTEPRKGEKIISLNETFRLKYEYSYKTKLLRAKTPEEIFLQHCGPDEWKDLKTGKKYKNI